MSKVSNNLIIYNGYPLSLVIAITAHSLVLAAILYLQGNSSVEALELVQPTVIKALLIEENPQIRNERMQEQRRVEQDRQREQEREQQRQQAERERLQEEAQQQAEREARETAEREAQQRAETARQEQAAREEREREEQERLERERLEQERQELLAQERLERERLERDEAQRRANEAAAAEAASSEFELVQSATGLIQQLVQEQWSRPPSARNGMRVIIRLQMLPTGEVTDVTITESSGDAAFDRSAETAVFRAAPFSELQAIPIQLFNQNFRTLSLTFQPEDLLN